MVPAHHKMKSLLLLVLVIYFSPCRGDWADGNDGVDRADGDLPNMPIHLKAGAASPKDCAQLCYSSDQCKAWAFVKPNCSGTPATPMCYLKAQVTQQRADPCRVSRRVM